MAGFANERGTNILEALTRAGGTTSLDQWCGVDMNDVDTLVGSRFVTRSLDGKWLTITPSGRAWVRRHVFGDR